MRPSGLPWAKASPTVGGVSKREYFEAVGALKAGVTAEQLFSEPSGPHGPVLALALREVRAIEFGAMPDHGRVRQRLEEAIEAAGSTMDGPLWPDTLQIVLLLVSS
jgi:hypothetical protein